MRLGQKQLEVLKAVLTTGSVSGAARALFVTQPAISRHLALIEGQLGFALFQRVRGRLQPTPEARVLGEEIEKALTGLERVGDLARALGERRAGTLRVTASPSAGQAIVPTALARFAADHPQVPVQFQTALVGDLVDQVLNDEAEIGVSALPVEHPHLAVTTLLKGRMVAVLPRSHRLARAASLSLADLQAEPVIVIGRRMPFGQQVLEACTRRQIELRIWAEVPAAHLACSMVNAGVGVAVVDSFTMLGSNWPALSIHPLRERIELTLALVRPRHRPISLVAQRFVERLRDTTQAIGQQRPAAPPPAPSRSHPSD